MIYEADCADYIITDFFLFPGLDPENIVVVTKPFNGGLQSETGGIFGG